jgi:UDP-glucose 4-epimerase
MRGALVTGATTPLGIALCRRLAADPEVGAVLAVGIEAEEQVTGMFPAQGKVRYRSLDLRRERRLRRLLFGEVRDLGIDTVVHCALHRSPSHGRQDAHCLAVDSTRGLLHLCERHPTLRRFVYRSYYEVFDVCSERPLIIDETHPVDLSPQAPPWIRDRVAADVTVCTRMGLSGLRIAVLRSAEVLGPRLGSQLYDYLQSRVCYRPLGFDPMVNLITVEDLARALHLAAQSDAEGVFTIPGRDTLPLSEVIAKWGRLGVGVPGALLSPLYRARAAVLGTQFQYRYNLRRFHYSGVLDGTRARRELGYEPRHPILWPGHR